MKVLVYTASSMCDPQFGIQMEMATKYINEGNDVVFCHCAGVMSACSANLRANRAMCNICQKGFRSGLKHLPKGVRIIRLTNNHRNNNDAYIHFNSLEEIKNYKYKSIDLGFSVLSVYISKTRNPTPTINNDFLDCINQLLKEAKFLLDAAEETICKESPDLIVFFNGRYFDTKPFYGLAVDLNKEYIATENVGGVRAGTEYRYVNFKNSIPHDQTLIFKNCLASWENSNKTDEEKTIIGKEFYEKRKNAVRAGDYVYTSNQIKGKLPVGFDSQKKNVVIYCSSEDEYCAISKEIDDYFIFKSQYEGIKYLSENICDENYHIYVRIHPNMKGLNFDYHLNLYKLSSKQNVTVIAPEDKISSYALMDVAYNVVVFGSTIGAESLYWGKSVVLLGCADYYYWGCCLIPRKREDFVTMVKNPVVYPFAKELAIKYGFNYLENSLAKKTDYIRITPKTVNLFGRNIYVFDYLKWFGSPLLYRFMYTIYSRLLTKLFRNRIHYPDSIVC